VAFCDAEVGDGVVGAGVGAGVGASVTGGAGGGEEWSPHFTQHWWRRQKISMQTARREQRDTYDKRNQEYQQQTNSI
jgi:hypothetical protein